jgi:hypothetical protein
MLLRFFGSLALAGVCMTASLAQTAQQKSDQGPVTAGYVETVTFPDYGIAIDAKLDTGADSSSLGVSGMERFRRAGKTWYRFTITGMDGKVVTVEQETSRVARVMRAEAEDTRRPIIRLRICLAGVTEETDFTLTDRSGRRTLVLIGRRFLGSRILVDSGRTHLFPQRCESRK